MNYDLCCKCQHYDFNLKQGVVCGLTHDKPNFDDHCKDYQFDPKRKSITESKERRKNTVFASLRHPFVGMGYCNYTYCSRCGFKNVQSQAGTIGSKCPKCGAVWHEIKNDLI